MEKLSSCMYINKTKRDQGFTLIEVLVAMAIGSLVMMVVYTAYNTQTKIYAKQDMSAEMQQHVRTALNFLQREIRMAGYNPDNARDPSCGTTSGIPGIYEAEAEKFSFSMDLDSDGKCKSAGENVTYSIFTDTDGLRKLGRQDTAADELSPSAIVDGMMDICFVYIFKPPRVGAAQKTGFSPTSIPTAGQLNDIQAVQVSLLARSTQPNREPDTTAVTFVAPLPDSWGEYIDTVAKQWGPFTDSFSRRLLTTTINCRNVGF